VGNDAEITDPSGGDVCHRQSLGSDRRKNELYWEGPKEPTADTDGVHY